MKPDPIDPTSPVPLYHQIAESIRARLDAGELQPGDALTPLRDAARAWGVNLHTVRHAYTALAREGLVEARGSQGTRVAASVPATREPRADLNAFLSRVVQEARSEHGIAPAELASAIVTWSGSDSGTRPVVHVVECSAYQCESHSRELSSRFDVDAREWSLEREGEPPPGPIVATYFHYNDIRRRWPHRMDDVRFVTIRPDAELLRSIPKTVERILVCEKDEVTADNVAADLSAALPSMDLAIESRVSSDLEPLIATLDDDAIVVTAPRTWASLTESIRAGGRILEAEYRIDEEELRALGTELGWELAVARAKPTVEKEKEPS